MERLSCKPYLQESETIVQTGKINQDALFIPANVNAALTLTQAQIHAYNHQGFLTGLDVFDPMQVKEHRAQFDQLFTEFLDRGMNGYSINGFQTRSTFIYDLVTNPLILDYVQDVIGPDIVCWGSQFFCKLPGDQREVSWHQDATYWPFEPTQTVTVWLAIDDVTLKNSPLEVIPGTHRHGPLAIRDSQADEHNVLSHTLAHAVMTDPVPMLLDAGQISLHTDLTVHGSKANRSDKRRCGLAIRYASTHVRAHLSGWNNTSILCRGQDQDNYWAHTPRPAEASPFATNLDTLNQPLAWPSVSALMQHLRQQITDKPDRFKLGIKLQINFIDAASVYALKLTDQPDITEGQAEAPYATMKIASNDFLHLVAGHIAGDQLYYAGRMQLEGDINVFARLTELQDLMRHPSQQAY